MLERRLLRLVATGIPALLWMSARCLGGESIPALPSRPAEHVVLMVWDGMRPDFISPRLTPNLWNLRTNGVFFKGNRCSYLSSTEVNGAALATGCYPEHSGIIANRMYFPALNLLEPVATESVDTIRRGDILTCGRYLQVQTLAERIQSAGFPTAIAGSKDVALLHDRAKQRSSGAARDSKVLHNGKTLPASLKKEIEKKNGKDYPAGATPNKPRDEWTTKALIDTFWEKGVPKFSLLWMSEPDATQHGESPGSTNSLAAIASSDRNLGLVLAALDKKGLRGSTDIFVVSDHGFSSITGGPDVCALLRKAGFAAYQKFDDPESGDVLVNGLGGSTMLHVIDHDRDIIRRLVEFFQESDFAGVIFSGIELPGTFPLSQVRLDAGTNAPDLVVSLRWSSQTNTFGVPGFLGENDLKKSTGSHTSLSPYDLHNTLVGSGPHLRRGYVNELPSGNIDVAPTILWLLGIESTGPMDGRVLLEAMADQPASIATPETRTLEATASLKHKKWRQYLKVSVVNGRLYFDEGNGGHQ